MTARDPAALLRGQRDGVLATLSTRRDGWPFASVAQYALTPDGELLFLLSGLAEHTRNLNADPRASFIVHEREDGVDPLAAGRITLLGRAARAPGDRATTPLRECYLARHPHASEYLQLADFAFYVLRVTEARFVAGFGDMGWISGDAVRDALRSED